MEPPTITPLAKYIKDLGALETLPLVDDIAVESTATKIGL